MTPRGWWLHEGCLQVTRLQATHSYTMLLGAPSCSRRNITKEFSRETSETSDQISTLIGSGRFFSRFHEDFLPSATNPRDPPFEAGFTKTSLNMGGVHDLAVRFIHQVPFNHSRGAPLLCWFCGHHWGLHVVQLKDRGWSHFKFQVWACKKWTNWLNHLISRE